MAELTKEVIKSQYKLMSIYEFRMSHGQGVSSQAIGYAIKEELLDYLQIDKRVRVIVLTEKSKSYRPNKSPSRV